MVLSSDSERVISRGVHTTQSLQIEIPAAEPDHSASLASQIYDNIESCNYSAAHKPSAETTTTDPLEYYTESGDTTQDLYKMKTKPKRGYPSPSKVEFRLCKSKCRRARRAKKSLNNARKEMRSKICGCAKSDKEAQVKEQITEENTFFNRLKMSFSKMRQPKVPKTTDCEKEQKMDDNYMERMDVYYFDHGNSAYFRTTDCPPQILSEILANQTTHYATRFWAEIFGSLHIGMTFFVTFFLQAYRFVLYSIVRAIIVGFLQMTSDYFVKPIITIIFNGLLQPPLILMYNIFSSIRDMLEPIAATFGNFLKPIAGLLRAIRLVNLTINRKEEVRKVSQEV